jgi:hypothetical protein
VLAGPPPPFYVRTIGNDNYLWFAGQDNGLMIVKFTKPLSELLP